MKPKLATRLVEPDHWTCPHGKRTRPESVLTFGPEVSDLCAKVGFAPDPQQELCLDLIFAIKPDGSPASFEFCVICCRQNLKTGLFKQVAIGWLFVTEQPLIVWSSHEMSTTSEAQRELGDLMLGSPHLRRHMMPNKNDGIYDANGEERIELANGQRILFKARTVSGGRGLAAPKLILDEAFALKASMMGSLLPLMTAQVDPQVLYGSSAGKADSDVLRDIRERGRGAMSPEMTYVEWGAEREACEADDCRHPKNAEQLGMGCALDREHLIRAANPTITTGRINIATIRNLRQALPPDEFMRECLGWWDELDAVERPIDVKSWDALGIDVGAVPVDPPGYYSLSISPERVAYIGVAIRNGEKIFLDLAEAARMDDPRKVVEWFAERRKERKIWVAIDSRDPAAALINELRAKKIRVNALGQSDCARGCVGLASDVDALAIEHVGQGVISGAMRVVGKKSIGKAGLWEWDPASDFDGVSGLRAITNARFGLTLKATPTEGRTSNRRAVVG